MQIIVFISHLFCAATFALDCSESLETAPSPDGAPCCRAQRAGFSEARKDVVLEVAPPSLDLKEEPGKINKISFTLGLKMLTISLSEEILHRISAVDMSSYGYDKIKFSFKKILGLKISLFVLGFSHVQRFTV